MMSDFLVSFILSHCTVKSQSSFTVSYSLTACGLCSYNVNPLSGLYYHITFSVQYAQYIIMSHNATVTSCATHCLPWFSVHSTQYKIRSFVNVIFDKVSPQSLSAARVKDYVPSFKSLSFMSVIPFYHFFSSLFSLFISLRNYWRITFSLQTRILITACISWGLLYW